MKFSCIESHLHSVKSRAVTCNAIIDGMDKQHTSCAHGKTSLRKTRRSKLVAFKPVKVGLTETLDQCLNFPRIYTFEILFLGCYVQCDFPARTKQELVKHNLKGTSNQKYTQGENLALPLTNHSLNFCSHAPSSRLASFMMILISQ